MKVSCPKCERSLRVPDEAANRHARCPACATVFRVPTPAENVDETVLGWLLEDAEAATKAFDARLLARTRKQPASTR